MCALLRRLTLCVALCLPVWPAALSAGWNDYAPVSINYSANPGEIDPHYNSGGRRIVRIENTTIAICPHPTGERTYRSTNNGATWEEIDQDGTFSGCLVTGPEQMVYHFWRESDNIFMVKFRYDAVPPHPILIYWDPNLSEGGHGVYNMLNANVDRDGTVFVATHWRGGNSDEGDTLYLVRSLDAGNTWTPSGQAVAIRQGSSEHSWGFAHLEVNAANVLFCVYGEWGAESIQLARSYDKGASWSTTRLANGSIHNPSILTDGASAVYVFAQASVSPSLWGLVFNKSVNGGNTWSGWATIDSASLSGYADPSPGLGSDGTVYVAYRSGARPDLEGVPGGDGCRERIARSINGGLTWDFPDDYFYDAQGGLTERTGCRSQIRYQTWWNYSGPLEWIWMQNEDEGTNRPIYYDINQDIVINDQGGNYVPRDDEPWAVAVSADASALHGDEARNHSPFFNLLMVSMIPVVVVCFLRFLVRRGVG